VTLFPLTANFNAFFGRLNPSDTFTKTAKSQHETIRGLIENPFGLASALRPTTFLQGSYSQDTAIDTINDIDIVVLCRELSFGGPPAYGNASWTRDRIFSTIAAPLLADGRYSNKVRYSGTSMCVKVDLGIKVEILPVVFKYGTTDPAVEPFMLFRPGTQTWEDGYARMHRRHLSAKNASAHGNFIPMIKVLKHLRALHGVSGVSFHLECLLWGVPAAIFAGPPADYIPAVLENIGSAHPLTDAILGIQTPCGERNILMNGEWPYAEVSAFRQHAARWGATAKSAASAWTEAGAVANWQTLLGVAYFPAYGGLGGLGGLGTWQNLGL
jgi:hypothetical protein